MEASPRRVTTPYEGTGVRPWDDGAPVPTPLVLHRTPVRPEWADYNGHMSESCYLLVFGDNSDAFFRFLGVGEEYRAAGHSLYTVETHLRNLREAVVGDPLVVTLRLLDHDAKRLHVFHEMRNGADDTVLATAEQMLLHVDMAAGRTAALPDELLRRLDAVRAAHSALPAPEAAGKPMGIRRSRTD
ncbi:thioesterase family protein [Streptomyces xiaopingdaonensis]|uniref:thioesterase family protein n=1 Tax=Streptomyces xiaopingdaonensis TaxID=1565415 RepID=UPI00049413E9|nr:thioesterase family protein [Streptomyces xiaopingdaonensis]